MESVVDLKPIKKRADDIAEWLKAEAPETATEQRHLDAGAPERAYWHYGYMMAVRDVLKLFEK